MADDTAPRCAPAAWIEAIEAGRADAEAGRVFDFKDVIAEFEREDDAALAASKSARTRSRRHTADA